VNSRIITAFGLAFLSLLTPLHSQAAATTPANYAVELVVFRNLMPDLEGKEIWSPDRVNLNIPGLDQARNAADSNDDTTDIGKAVALLDTDDKYQVLTHKRWIQTADARSSSPVMRITDPAGDLDGTVVFYMSRFLHVDVDLLLKDESGQNADTTPVLSTTDNTQPMTVSASGTDNSINNQELAYRIDESRRIRSNQMNYFDHPKFGVLLIITPMES
jgi:hypothetical protein